MFSNPVCLPNAATHLASCGKMLLAAMGALMKADVGRAGEGKRER
jgi:hypothetical protein